MKWRYTGLALVFSFLMGSGIATVVNNLLEGTKETLAKARTLLSEMSEQAEETKKLTVNSKEQLRALSDEISELKRQADEKSKAIDDALAKSGVNLTFVSDINTQLVSLTSRLDDFGKTLTDLVRQQNQAGSIPATDYSRIAGALTANDKTLQQISSDLQTTAGRIALSVNSVFVQFFSQAADGRKVASDIADELKTSGFVIPGIERVAKPYNEIRFFYPEDKDGADALKKAVDASLAAHGLGTKMKVVPLTDYPIKPRQGVLELWLAL
jgi:hypothetical protein